MTDLFVTFYAYAPYALCGLCGVAVALFVWAVHLFFWTAEKANEGNES